MVIDIDNKQYKVLFIHKKVKRTFIKINAQKDIIATSSQKLSEKDINELIYENIEWIKKQIRIIKDIPIQKNEFLLFGEIYQLVYDQGLKAAYKIEGKNVFYRDKGLDKLVNDQCLIISELFKKCSTYFKVTVTPFVTFRKMKSKWGVCHYKTGKIVINKILVHVPVELINYVLFHEFTHFIHPDHSKNFYNDLSKLVPNHKQLKQRLKEYSFLL
jgi:predicted metal-dependent hydrolase